MESPIKSLVFASIALLSYTAEASLLEGVESLQQDKHAQLDRLTDGYMPLKTSLRCLGKDCRINEITTLSYNPESKRYTTYIAANTDHLANKNQASAAALKDGTVVTAKLVRDWGLNALKEGVNSYQQQLTQGAARLLLTISSNIPLSTAIWVFLGGLFGLLATQRRKELG